VATESPNTSRFQAAQPKIPGVPEKHETSARNATKGSPLLLRPGLLSAGAGVATLILLIAVVWWPRGTAQTAARTGTVNRTGPSTDPAAAKSSDNLAVAPGPIAKVSEMKQAWATKTFLFRKTDGEAVPALLVRLPGDTYWAIALRAPYESCTLELASVAKLRSEYNMEAKYPMIVDPCTHAVFDLTQYGSGPNGLVRGAIVAGLALRPPLAIEVEVKHGELIALRME